MLAGLEGHDGCRSMPVVRSRDYDSVNVPVLQELAYVLLPFRRLPCNLADRFLATRQGIGITVTQETDLASGHLRKIGCQGLSSRIDTDDADMDLVVGPQCLFLASADAGDRMEWPARAVTVTAAACLMKSLLVLIRQLIARMQCKIFRGRKQEADP